MRIVRVGVTAAALALTLIALPARPRASIVMALDLPELVRQSDHIAIVDVLSVRSAWDEAGSRIFTTIDVKVVERWKGAADAAGKPAEHLTIVQPGGTVGDISMTIAGLSTFSEGERAVVFLRGSVARSQPVGMAQGKRLLRYEPRQAKWIASGADLRQLLLVPRTPGAPSPSSSTAPPLASAAPVAPTSPPVNRELPVDELGAEVKRLVGTRAR